MFFKKSPGAMWMSWFDNLVFKMCACPSQSWILASCVHKVITRADLSLIIALNDLSVLSSQFHHRKCLCRVQFAIRNNELLDILSKKRDVSTPWGKNMWKVRTSTRNIFCLQYLLVSCDFWCWKKICNHLFNERCRPCDFHSFWKKLCNDLALAGLLWESVLR